MGNRYMGSAGHIVMVKGNDGATKPLPPRNDLVNHSPDGFSWGYGGSGPAQLALAILVYEYGVDSVQATRYQKFKEDMIATMEDNRNFTLFSKDIAAWWLEIFKQDWPKGQRVRYIPDHANGDATHADCENGCIKRVRDTEAAFVLYDVKNKAFRMVTGDEPFTAASTRFENLIKIDAALGEEDEIDFLDEARRLYKYLTNQDADPDLTQDQLYETINKYDA